MNTKLFGSRFANMSATDIGRVLKAATLYKQICSTCHGPDGEILAIGGGNMPVPPFVGFKRISRDKRDLIRIPLHGLTGPIKGKTYSNMMATLGAGNDEWVISVLSYVRHNYGRIPRGGSATLRVEDVKEIRASGARTKPWTVAELEKVDQLKTEQDKIGK